LETRFPEKVVVTAENYLSLHAEMSLITARIKELEQNLAPLVQRLSVVEANAVHKGAVQDLVSVVKGLKDEYISLKASMGMSRMGDSELQAMLNGQPIDPNGGI
jgi:hypothetical protein